MRSYLASQPGCNHCQPLPLEAQTCQREDEREESGVPEEILCQMPSNTRCQLHHSRFVSNCLVLTCAVHTLLNMTKTIVNAKSANGKSHP
jgi:hypothetical protein